MSSRNDYTTEILRTREEVYALREIWQRFALDPIIDMDVYSEVIQGRSEIQRPHVVVLKRAGVVESILAGRIEKKALEINLGYRRIALPQARFLITHTGLLGNSSEGNARFLVDSVLKSLKEGEADVAWFHGIDQDSAFYRIARGAGGMFTRDHFPQSILRWIVRLPGTYEEFFRGLSSKTRNNLKRHAKKLQKSFAGQMEIRTFRHPSDLEWVLRDTEIVASKTYQRGLEAGFILNDETRRVMTLAANRGWLRAYLLYISDKPSAFLTGFSYRKTYFGATTGYDPELREFAPGVFLLQRLLEDICEDGTVSEVDFGFGDAQYKRELCDTPRLDGSFLLFAPNLRGVSLNLMRAPLVFATRYARSVLNHAHLLQEIKKAWRGHLARRAQTLQSKMTPGGGGGSELRPEGSQAQVGDSEGTRTRN